MGELCLQLVARVCKTCLRPCAGDCQSNEECNALLISCSTAVTAASPSLRKWRWYRAGMESSLMPRASSGKSEVFARSSNPLTLLSCSPLGVHTPQKIFPICLNLLRFSRQCNVKYQGRDLPQASLATFLSSHRLLIIHDVSNQRQIPFTTEARRWQLRSGLS